MDLEETSLPHLQVNWVENMTTNKNISPKLKTIFLNCSLSKCKSVSTVCHLLISKSTAININLDLSNSNLTKEELYQVIKALAQKSKSLIKFRVNLNENKNLDDNVFKQIFLDLNQGTDKECAQSKIIFGLGKDRDLITDDTNVSYKLRSVCRYEWSKMEEVNEKKGMQMKMEDVVDDYDDDTKEIEDMMAQLKLEFEALERMNK